MKNGWHTIAGYKVLVENGKIRRGILNPGWNERPGYIYREDRKNSCWTSEDAISADAFRAGVRRGTITIK